MLNTSAIIISTKNHKSESFDTICNYVRFIVRNAEYEKLIGKNEYKSLRKKVEDAHADADPLTCEEDFIRDSLTPAESEIFLTMRKEINDLKEEMTSTGKTLEDFNALTDTDRTFIILQAHTAMKSVKLDDAILENINMGPVISKFFASGSLKGIKDMFRSIFAKVVGSEGSLFYGVKLRKSDFSDEDLRSCLSYFRGNAARSVSNKGGTKTYGEYEWVKKDESKSAQAMALTNLFAVVLDRSKDYEVIKPEKKTEATK